MHHRWEYLESEIEEHYLEFLENLNTSIWQKELFKVRKQSVYFYFLKMIKNSPYYFLPEQILNLLTLHRVDSISPVEHIILLPRFVETKKYFLTNIYLLEENILIFYLAPKYIFSTILSSSFDENLPLAEERGVLYGKTTTRLENLFSTISIFHHHNGHANNMIKFLYPKDILDAKEIMEMKELDAFYDFTVNSLK